MRKRWISILVLMALAGVLGGRYLFRTTERDQGSGPIAQYRWRWGLAREELVDQDRDGHFEKLFVFKGFSLRFYTDVVPDMGFIDTDSNGTYDLRAWYENNVVVKVEQDLDGDGDPELTLEGKEAAALFQEKAWPGVPYP